MSDWSADLDDLLGELQQKKQPSGGYTYSEPAPPQSSNQDVDNLIGELEGIEARRSTSLPPASYDSYDSGSSSYSQPSYSTPPPAPKPAPSSYSSRPKETTSYNNNPPPSSAPTPTYSPGGKSVFVECSRCGTQIRDEVVEAAKMPYHKNCFKCFKCAKSLQGTKFIPGDKPQLFCSPCGMRWLHESGKLK